MKINYNASAIIANQSLSNSDSRLSKSIERLSSGYRINRAKDDAAGLAISKKMNAQIRGLSTATQNASDGISAIETAEGALTEIHAMLQRMNEMAVKASNGTITSSDRIAINDEVNQLKKEVVRISNETEFNGKTLLDGSFDLKGYASIPGIDVNSYSDTMPLGKYNITVNNVGSNPWTATINSTTALGDGQNFILNAVAKYDGNKVTFTDNLGKEVSFTVDPALVSSTATFDLDITGLGSMNLQIGANENQTLGMRIPEVSLETLGLENSNCLTKNNANEMLDKIQKSIETISFTRSRLGAYQNRLEHTVSSLDITHENMTAAFARIMDVNMATEMTDYTKYQVLVQAGTSMLAQANQRPEQVLQLLQ